MVSRYVDMPCIGPRLTPDRHERGGPLPPVVQMLDLPNFSWSGILRLRGGGANRGLSPWPCFRPPSALCFFCCCCWERKRLVILPFEFFVSFVRVSLDEERSSGCFYWVYTGIGFLFSLACASFNSGETGLHCCLALFLMTDERTRGGGVCFRSFCPFAGAWLFRDYGVRVMRSRAG